MIESATKQATAVPHPKWDVLLISLQLEFGKNTSTYLKAAEAVEKFITTDDFDAVQKRLDEIGDVNTSLLCRTTALYGIDLAVVPEHRAYWLTRSG